MGWRAKRRPICSATNIVAQRSTFDWLAHLNSHSVGASIHRLCCEPFDRLQTPASLSNCLWSVSARSSQQASGALQVAQQMRNTHSCHLFQIKREQQLGFEHLSVFLTLCLESLILFLGSQVRERSVFGYNREMTKSRSSQNKGTHLVQMLDDRQAQKRARVLRPRRTLALQTQRCGVRAQVQSQSQRQSCDPTRSNSRSKEGFRTRYPTKAQAQCPVPRGHLPCPYPGT